MSQANRELENEFYKEIETNAELPEFNKYGLYVRKAFPV